MFKRYTVISKDKVLAEYYGVDFPDFCPNYNVAPPQDVMGIRLNDAGEREVVFFSVGFNSTLGR